MARLIAYDRGSKRYYTGSKWSRKPDRARRFASHRHARRLLRAARSEDGRDAVLEPEREVLGDG